MKIEKETEKAIQVKVGCFNTSSDATKFEKVWIPKSQIISHENNVLTVSKFVYLRVYDDIAGNCWVLDDRLFTYAEPAVKDADKATDKQVAFVEKLQAIVGFDVPENMTKSQASELIEHYKGYARFIPSTKTTAKNDAVGRAVAAAKSHGIDGQI